MRTRLAALTVTTTLLTTISMVGAPATAFADEIRDGQWYLDSFNIDKVHELSQGAGVTIGVIDTGIDPDHPDLKGSVKAGTDFGDATGDGLDDPDGHGTAVASVVAGHGHGDGNTEGVMGIAPKAEILAAGVDWKQNGYDGHGISDAIEWLADNGADIIVTALGLQSMENNDEAVKYATDKGIPVVASSGNLKSDSDADGPLADKTQWPASAIGAIPVSGTSQDGNVWNKSVTLKLAATQPQLGLSAPAESIPIALPDGGYKTVNGTSFSAPIVAGTLALIKSAYPDLGIKQLNERLLYTVDDKGDKGFDNKYGWGIVNPYSALTETVQHHEGGASSQSEIVPLNKQGKTTSDGNQPSSEKTTASADSSNALVPGSDSGLPLWALITIVTAAIAITAIIILVIAKVRRPKTTPPPHQKEQASVPAFEAKESPHGR